MIECEACKGTGRCDCDYDTLCTHCFGTGKCFACAGTGIETDDSDDYAEYLAKEAELEHEMLEQIWRDNDLYQTGRPKE